MCSCLSAGLTKIGNRPIPHFSPKGVVREPFNLAGEAVGVERLDGVHNMGMESTPLFIEQAAVGDFLRERVLKRVFELRKEARLVEKLSGLQMGERPTQRLLREHGDGLQQREGD